MLAPFQIGLQRPAEVGRNGSRVIDLFAEVAHHVRAGITEHAVPHQKGHQPFQKSGLPEHHVGRPLGLVHRPVIAGGTALEQLLVQGMNLLRQAPQQFRPVGPQLLVQQLLGPLVVFDPDKAVALLAIFQPLFVHLPRQPFPSIQAHLNIEGKPGLQTGIHPSQFGMDLVEIQGTARSEPPDHVRAAMLESRTRFQRTERADQSAFQLPVGGDPPRQGLLVRRSVTHVDLRPSLLAQ